MASILLPPDATLEAYAHCCTASQLQEHLTGTPRERLQTHGHIAVERSMEFNKDPLGVMGVLLEQPEIQVNQPAFGGDEGNTLLHSAVLMHDEDENEKIREGSLLLILKRPDLDPNVGNSNLGDTPLHSAARALSDSCVDILLDDPRVNIAAVNYNVQTCLHVVCDVSSKETSVNVRIARKIIGSARSTVRSFPQFLRMQDRFGNTGLHYAAARGLENVVVALLEAESVGNKHELAVKQNHHGNLALHMAAANGHREIVKRMLEFVDESLFDDIVVNIKDQDGFGLLHHSVRNGRQDILQLGILYPRKPTSLNFDLYMELLELAPDKIIADFFLQRLNDEVVKNSKGKEDEVYILNFAIAEKTKTLVKLIVKWHPKQAVVAMHEAVVTGNKTIQAMMRDHPEVQRDIEKIHKKYTYYLTAANAILVVSVLIITLTFGHCLTSVEAAQRRKDISELKEFGGPPEMKKVHWIDFFLLPRWAFIQAMVATALAAFAALPFSFAFFFQEIDDTKVKKLLHRTRVLIISASYFLMLSLASLFFSFVCSSFVAPYFNNQRIRWIRRAIACEVALGFFFLCATLLLGFIFIHHWKHRTKEEKQGSIKFVEVLKLIIAR